MDKSLNWRLNNAMHTDSAMTLRFHAEDQRRGAGDGDRSAEWGAAVEIAR
jgi:hypothetical protein